MHTCHLPTPGRGAHTYTTHTHTSTHIHIIKINLILKTTVNDEVVLVQFLKYMASFLVGSAHLFHTLAKSTLWEIKFINLNKLKVNKVKDLFFHSMLQPLLPCSNIALPRKGTLLIHRYFSLQPWATTTLFCFYRCTYSRYFTHVKP